MQLTIGELEMYYEITGEGTPLLCLPAFPFDHRMWRAQRPLDDIAQRILPDYRGTGASSLTPGPYTMDLLADDMLALLDHLRIDRVVVMGVSMGVYTAFALYAKAPERFRGFIIADTRAEADSAETAARRMRTVEGLRAEGTAFLRERVNDLFAATTRREHPELVEEMQAVALSQHPEGLAQITIGMALRPDRTDMLTQILTPTLVLCGEEDTVSPASGMLTMANLIPGSRFYLIPRAGHLSPLEHPAAVNLRIRDFLASLPPV